MYESWWGVELAPGNQLNPSWVISIRSHIKYIRKVDTHCYVLTTRKPVGEGSSNGGQQQLTPTFFSGKQRINNHRPF